MCSLGNRFNRHAQLSKQAMLARLVDALQKQQLQSDALEAHHSLLSAIIHLSRKPLQNEYIPSAAALACLQAGATGSFDLLHRRLSGRTAVQVTHTHRSGYGDGHWQAGVHAIRFWQLTGASLPGQDRSLSVEIAECRLGTGQHLGACFFHELHLHMQMMAWRMAAVKQAPCHTGRSLMMTAQA